MSALGLRRQGLGRSQASLVAALLGLAALGWAVTGERMAGMDDGPGTDPGALGFFLTAWVVMMGAMMFPSVAPMVLAYDRIRIRRRELRRRAPGRAGTAVFVGGYVAAWTAFGLGGWALYRLVEGLSIDALAWDRGGHLLAGGVITLAAVYELTPAKDVCLRKCRTPLDFVFGAWRDGVLGAFRTGAEHGAWCVGCCWALMAALFALGVMSVAWMAFVAALIASQKLLPWARRRLVGATALLLVLLGLGVALAPERVPGLAVPGEGEAMPMTEQGGAPGG